MPAVPSLTNATILSGANASADIQRDLRATAHPSYLQALKSAVLIGGSSMATIAVGVVRNKAMAVLLGPSGVGLIGLYASIADLAQSLLGMGVQSSGVRQIAEAAGTGDARRIAQASLVLKRLSVVLGLVSGVFLLALAGPISSLTFGTPARTAGVALLSLAVCCRIVSAGQVALIQGLRRIGDLAQMNVLAAVASVAIGIPLIYVLRERGIVPSILAVACVTLVSSWWYSRRVSIPHLPVGAAETGREASAILKLGAAFMASGFLTMGAAYLIRIIVLRKIGYEAAGYYQASWSLGGLYVGFILQAMGADFYPRLTAVAGDNEQCTRLVNEQAQVSLLMAGPGVIGTLALASLVLGVFYSADFQSAVGLLRWICLGMMLRVVAWPLGYIIVAKGLQQTFFWTEVAATVVHVGLAWALVSVVGISGAGAAFFGLYLWHTVLVYLIARSVSQFRWSPESLRMGGVFLPLVFLVFASFYVIPSALASLIGIATALFCAAYSTKMLLKLLPPEAVPHPVWRCAVWLRLASQPSAS